MFAAALALAFVTSGVIADVTDISPRDTSRLQVAVRPEGDRSLVQFKERPEFVKYTPQKVRERVEEMFRKPHVVEQTPAKYGTSNPRNKFSVGKLALQNAVELPQIVYTTSPPGGVDSVSEKIRELTGRNATVNLSMSKSTRQILSAILNDFAPN